MLTIRREQAEAFRQYHLQKFEDEMVRFVNKCFPKLSAIAGESTCRRVIRLGVEKAKTYGFTYRGPVRFYIELMFLFGSSFDIDPQYPWATAILRDRAVSNQMVRAERFFDAKNEYLYSVHGPKHQYFIEALRRLRDINLDELVRGKYSLADTAVETVRLVYPEQYEYLGNALLTQIVQQVFVAARNYKLDAPKGMLLLVAFALLVGHGFAEDPLYPWIGRRLRDPRFDGTRTEELLDKAMLYLNSVLKHNPEH
jgi:hypothetical protein